MWPVWGRTVSELPEGPIDFAEWFGRQAPVVLEIGSGMGEATSQLAAAEPEVNYVAVVVYEAGLGQLMRRAEQLGVENLRLIKGDAVVLLSEHIAPGRCRRCGLLPDPWPKAPPQAQVDQPSFVKLVASGILKATLHRPPTGGLRRADARGAFSRAHVA